METVGVSLVSLRQPTVTKMEEPEERQVDTPTTKNNRSATKKITSLYKTFCSRTSIHGFQYVGDSEMPVLERLCWAIAVCLGFGFCYYFIDNVYQKWVTSPVIVSFAKTSTPVANIPFPAVTICTGNKVRKAVFDYKKVYHSKNKTDEERKKLEYGNLLCNLFYEEDMDKIVDRQAIEFLEEVGTPLEEILGVCKWRNQDMSCKKIFTSVLTDAGLCHTFNMLKAEELFSSHVDPNQFLDHLNHERNSSWTMENGYESRDKTLFPYRSYSSGSHEGLVFFYVQNTTDLVDSCGFPGFGFKLTVHSPVDFPQVNDRYFRVPAEHDVVVGITANMIQTSTKLQENYKPADRRCFLSSERDLLFFDIYSEANCELECFVNASLRICNCSSFYMPRAPNTPICGAGSRKCVDEVLENLHLEEEAAKCNCLPSCTAIRYNIEVSQSKINWSEGLLFTPEEALKIGRMQLYFKSNRFITRRRSELYGVSDFIANCGGLLGLFLGFSFLSLVEIFYFLLMKPMVVLMRLWCRHRFSKQHQRKLQRKEP